VGATPTTVTPAVGTSAPPGTVSPNENAPAPPTDRVSVPGSVHPRELDVAREVLGALLIRLVAEVVRDLREGATEVVEVAAGPDLDLAQTFSSGA